MSKTLTSANASLSIAVDGLFSSPQSIQGFEVDDAFESETVAQAEVRMGVDGKLSGGKIFTPYKMTVHLMPTSPSIDMFEVWRTQQDAAYDVFSAQGSIYLPSTNKAYTLQNGFLTTATPHPSVKKMLQGVTYEITWERIVSEPTA